jgi:CRP/FNR family cyclic AMP-dependent transcriptional regulator
MVTVQRLKEFELFNGLADSNLERIAELCQVHPLHEGDRIFEEGTRATNLHICCSGKVDIVTWVKKPWNKYVRVHQSQPGEVFGWSALVAPYNYSASAICAEAGEEIRIRSNDLLDMLHQHPDIGYTIMQNLAADIGARMTQMRQSLIAEWQSGSGPTSSSAWGEPQRR